MGGQSVFMMEVSKGGQGGTPCLLYTSEKGLNFTGGFSTLSQFLQKQRKDRHTEEVEAESILSLIHISWDSIRSRFSEG